MKLKITDGWLKQPQEPGLYMDTQVNRFAVRIGASGIRTFVVYRRWPGSHAPVMRTIGRYGEVTLMEARATAAEWDSMARKGVDPVREAKRAQKAQETAERVRRANTFGSALDAYLAHKAGLRSIHRIERDLRRECAIWMARPIADIDPRTVKALVIAIKNRGHKEQARATLAMVGTFFNWVVDSEDYGIEVNPCLRIKPTVLIGKRATVGHVLRDCDFRAFWKATGALGYPAGSLFRLLALSAVRRNEAAKARWSEFDRSAGLWVIPAARMKSGAAHSVPLTPDILALLDTLPRFDGGNHLFSITNGAKPFTSFGKAKADLDTLMQTDLASQGETFEPFKLHDIRRSCRTRFSWLRVPAEVCEALLAHAKPGLDKTYNLHLYPTEKREALIAWHRTLRSIVEPS